MRIEFQPAALGSGSKGLEIGVKGFRSNPGDHERFPSQVYIEVYEGKLRVCVWDGRSEDPATHDIEPLTYRPDGRDRQKSIVPSRAPRQTRQHRPGRDHR